MHARATPRRLTGGLMGPLLVLALLSPVSAASPPVAVTSCGQSVPDYTTGFLTADLDCGAAPVGVLLGRKGRLDLGGFTLSGATNAVVCTPAE
jgi:hypothetical protein